MSVKQTQLPVEAPNESRRVRFKFDPDRHYVKVQRDGVNYEGDLDAYLDMESIVAPGEDMYRIESEDKRITGDKRMLLLSCRKADFDARMKEVADRTEAVRRQSKPDEEFTSGLLSA